MSYCIYVHSFDDGSVWLTDVGPNGRTLCGTELYAERAMRGSL